MSDLIDRQATLRALEECIKARLEWNSDSREERQGLNVAMCVIEDLPSAQTVTPCHLGSPCEYQNPDAKMPSAQPDSIESSLTQNALDTISILSELRSNYSCFDEAEEPYYRALSEAIEAVKAERKGHWIDISCGTASLWKCSECGEIFSEDFYYCPNCGADMRGE